jgi:hypothetical protein
VEEPNPATTSHRLSAGMVFEDLSRNDVRISLLTNFPSYSCSFPLLGVRFP